MLPATKRVSNVDDAAQLVLVHGVPLGVLSRYSSSWLGGGGRSAAARDRSGSHDKTKKLP